jgi:hypothetical protein
MYSLITTLREKIFFFTIFLLFNFGVVAQPDIPTGFAIKSYDFHNELTWFPNAEPNLSAYKIYRSEDGNNFELVESVTTINTSWIDFVGEHDRTFQYKITAINNISEESDFSETKIATTFEMTDEELLTMVQEYTFRYFWDFAHPVSGLARERNTTSIVTTGGSGFGVMAILVGIERGFITPEEAVTRLLKIVSFLENADRFYGVFPHWMNGATGETIPFSANDDGGDLVETAFLIQGLLTVRQCINGDTPDEIALRDKITQIWEDVNWNWYRKSVQQVLYWHWSPNVGWEINQEISGFNEAQIVYLLAIASPTHSVPASLYHNGWAGGNYTNGNSYYNYPLTVGPNKGGPLFFAHYSYLGFDPRYIKDDYANYFNQNVHHTLINRAYCIENPKNYEGYGVNCWGLTASDNPFGYLAHEPTPARDNGTITPTAALSSMPYTPELSIAALKHFYRVYGADLWGKYGFYDAFNLDENWFATSYLAIDQGPIIGMIENYRTNLLWDCFMTNPEIQGALDAIGFVPDSVLVTSILEQTAEKLTVEIFPNPVTTDLTVSFSLPKNQNLTATLTNLQGDVIVLLQNQEFLQGKNTISLETNEFPSGIYFLKLRTELFSITKKLVMVR